MIVFAGAVVAGATGAFFSDTETSTGNVFAAGAIDLGIDNESYYNGVATSSTSWTLDFDIDNCINQRGGPCLFFNFFDLKPGDYGEDTISLHVTNNEAWLCADVSVTEDDDETCVEPEEDAEGAGVCNNSVPSAQADGDLADELDFMWWADDGDNVLENDEVPLPGGPLGALGVGNSTTVQLADSQQNIWSPNTPGPLPGNQTKYIGKAWCFGPIGTAPITQDGFGDVMTPAGNNDGNGTPGQPSDGGLTCDGSNEGNETQTDSMTADIKFTAVQARHNDGFRCEPPKEEDTATITLHKILVKDNGGNEATSSFSLTIDGDSVPQDTPIAVTPGTHTISELGVSGYEASFSGDCDLNGEITVAANESKSCTITNDDLQANVTLLKNVVGGSATPADFTMRVNGFNTPHGTSRSVNANSSTTITEVDHPDYEFTSISGTGCPSGLGVDFALNEGQAITCTITNTED
jgi:predicted ribosomally synthesized peptide with SipW-like signal peptide